MYVILWKVDETDGAHTQRICFSFQGLRGSRRGGGVGNNESYSRQIQGGGVGLVEGRVQSVGDRGGVCFRSSVLRGKTLTANGKPTW